MNIMGPLISIDRFQVHQMPDDMKLITDTITTMNVPGLAGDLQRLAAGVTLD